MNTNTTNNKNILKKYTVPADKSRKQSGAVSKTLRSWHRYVLSQASGKKENISEHVDKVVYGTER